MVVRALEESEIPAALALARDVFQIYEAPTYPAEGVAEFHRYLEDPQAMAALCFYGAFEADLLIGMLARRGSHISLLFVLSAYQRRGVGQALFNFARRGLVGSITVHAAPDAVPFYTRIGFTPRGPERVENGIRYVPMIGL